MRTDRMGFVDSFRFLMILLIMSHHIYMFGYSDQYLFSSCWAWVDYFFLLTGFFTMAHFAGQDSPGSCAKESLTYTFRKMAAYFPLVFLAVTAQYIAAALPFLEAGQPKKFIHAFYDWPYEVLLLSSTGIVWPKMPPIWFLSAMALTLPLLVYVILRFRDLRLILSWFIPFLYYGYMKINTVRDWPNDMVRAFCCMMFGIFVYFISQKLKSMELSSLKKIFLTAAELTALLLCLYITIFNKATMNLLPLLFFVHSVILLSGRSHTAGIKGSLCTYLGALSMPMFLLHWPVGTIAMRLAAGNTGRLCIYYAGTILLSAAAVFLQRKVKSRQTKADSP